MLSFFIPYVIRESSVYVNHGCRRGVPEARPFGNPHGWWYNGLPVGKPLRHLGIGCVWIPNGLWMWISVRRRGASEARPQLFFIRKEVISMGIGRRMKPSGSKTGALPSPDNSPQKKDDKKEVVFVPETPKYNSSICPNVRRVWLSLALPFK